MAVIPTYQEFERAGDLRNGRWEDLIAYVREAEKNKRALASIQKILAINTDPANMPMLPPLSLYAAGHRHGMALAYEDTLDTLKNLLTDDSVPG